MNKNSKIYIAGHNGMVGSALWKNLKKKGYNNLLGCYKDQLDLLDQNAVKLFFETEKPEYVFLAAAKVGGIAANNNYRAQFIYENIQIQNNIIHFSFINNVKKLLFLGSSCIYPKNAPQPLREEYLLTSELEYTNEPYAIAKIAGIKMCESYNLQYKTNFISVMPTNLYGLNDNYDLEKSHVLPAFIRKFHLAKSLMNNDLEALHHDIKKNPIDGLDSSSSLTEFRAKLKKYGIYISKDASYVRLWGTGNPRREFLLADEMADACVYIIENVDFEDLITADNEIRNKHINIGCGTDLSLKELAALVKETVGFDGDIQWDSGKPDGTLRKLLDVRKLNNLGWKSRVDIKTGVNKVYQNYIGKVDANDSPLF